MFINGFLGIYLCVVVVCSSSAGAFLGGSSQPVNWCSMLACGYVISLFSPLVLSVFGGSVVVYVVVVKLMYGVSLFLILMK
jgi:hypothetical protein